MIRGYHAWTKREVSKRAQEDQALAEQREQIFQANRGVYGSPRIHAELQEQGRRYGRKRIARLMQERGISAQRKRRRVRTTDSHHSHPVAPNLLNRDFTASAPNTKWVTDITAIETAEGYLYLAGVVDIYPWSVAARSYRRGTAPAIAPLRCASAPRRRPFALGRLFRGGRKQRHRRRRAVLA